MLASANTPCVFAHVKGNICTARPSVCHTDTFQSSDLCQSGNDVVEGLKDFTRAIETLSSFQTLRVLSERGEGGSNGEREICGLADADARRTWKLRVAVNSGYN